MAVRALPRPRTRDQQVAAPLPPTVLALTLVAPALDVLDLVQPFVLVERAGILGAALATAVLVVYWVRIPRATWIAAACVAASAGLVLRLFSAAEVAPLMSLLSIVALGIGGAFASRGSADLSLADA